MSFNVLEDHRIWFIFAFMLLFWCAPIYYYFPKWAPIRTPWIIGVAIICFLLGILHYPISRKIGGRRQ